MSGRLATRPGQHWLGGPHSRTARQAKRGNRLSDIPAASSAIAFSLIELHRRFLPRSGCRGNQRLLAAVAIELGAEVDFRRAAPAAARRHAVAAPTHAVGA